MLGVWGQLSYRWRWQILAVAIAVAAAAGVWGAGIFAAVSGSGIDDPASESSRAGALAARQLPEYGTDVVLIYTAAVTVDDPGYRRKVQTVVAGLPRSAVRHAADYWSTGDEALVSADRRSTVVALRLVGSDDDARRTSYSAISERLGRPPPGLSVQRGGDAAVFADIGHRVENDIKRAEALSFPLLLVLLTVCIGSVVAACLPLLIGALAIVGAFAVLRCLTLVTSISVFTVNIVTMLGIGLAIDYALLMVARFREELARSGTVEDAVRATVATAGRTIAFSGITVALALSCLLVYPQVYFRSMGLGGMAAAGIAVLASLTVLPALLSVLGPRIRAGRARLPTGRRPGRHRAPIPGLLYRVARSVMRRPRSYALGILVGLLLLAGPVTHARFGGIDVNALPPTTESRVAAERLQADFPEARAEPIEAIVSFPAATTRTAAATELRPYVSRLQRLPGVVHAEIAANVGRTAAISVLTDTEPRTLRARSVAAEVRAADPPRSGIVLVGGRAAELSDLLTSLRSGLGWLAMAVAGVTLVSLFLAFGSIVLPIKAIAMSVLSLAASYGAIVWIFQDGHLSGVLDFTVTGAVEPTQLVLLFVVAFALSTDYEVFLLGRIREEWDATGDNDEAVARGLQSTGPVVSSAGALLVVVIGSFSMSGISFIKMIGVGMVIAVVLDASVVRMLLVPATMRLLGPLNWWAPEPLSRWWRRHRPHGAALPAQRGVRWAGDAG